MTIYRSEKGEFPATLRDTMNHEQMLAYEGAANGIHSTLGWKQWKADDLNPVAEVFQVPMTYDQLCLISRLLLPLTSDNYQCEDCPSTMFDYLHHALCQVSYEHTSQAFVSIYQVDRCYGGPEEGGWWYDHWMHMGSDSFDTVEGLRQHIDSLREFFPVFGNAMTTEEVLDAYAKFVSGEDSYCRDRRDPQVSGYHHEWFSRAAETREFKLDLNKYDECMYLVFEWAPGMAATVHRPHYC